MSLKNLAAILDPAAPDDRPLVIEVSPGGDEKRDLSYGEGRRRIASLARGLLKRGLKRGEAVAIVAANSADAVLLIGRILLGWVFVRSGYGKLFNVEAYAATFPVRGLPPFLAYIAVPVEFFGGIALILGLATRYVVLVMVVFMLVATFSSHRYWEFADAAARRAQ